MAEKEIKMLEKPKTCEEYVLQQLELTRETLSAASQQYYNLSKEHEKLLTLVKEVVATIELKERDGITSLYIDGEYACSFLNGEGKALKKLVELYKGETK